VRLKHVHIAGVILLACAVSAPRASTQNPDTMMPEQSAAKGKQILASLINALGGPGYTEVRESHCEGRRSQFGHNGEPLRPVLLDFSEYRRYPDKARTEYIGKGHNTFLPFLVGVDGLDWSHGGVIITLYNGEHGWTFDRSGVNELPATAVSDFQEQVKRNVDNLLRLRLKEPGMAIRFGGSDTVDLKSVDWVEITDSQERKFRLAVDRSTHLMVRSVVLTKDEETQQINEDVAIYTNYQLKDSVWTPLQISREHNGRRASQIFYDSCKFNPGFSDDIFDKSSLSKQGSQALAKKSKN
jgi:outer membrane lipoprotein-sorting protein